MMSYNLEWLKRKIEDGDAVKYIFFWGHSNKAGEEVGKFVFSQWYPLPFTVGDVEYKTAEHWMMAQKALLFGDSEIFAKITQSEKPGEVKALGRQIKNFDPQKWDDQKIKIVTEGNVHKFQQHPTLKQYLLETGERVLVEASPLDSIWGVGLAQDSPSINNPNTWNGLNLLGFALMEARDLLRNNP